MFAMLLAAACAFASHAQEQAFDAEKTIALFAGTEWLRSNNSPNDFFVTFSKNGQVVFKGNDGEDWRKTFFGTTWRPSGAKSIILDNNTICEFSSDRKRILATDTKRKMCTVIYRGPKMPPPDRAARIGILCKPGQIWATQLDGHRRTISFEYDRDRAVINSKKGEATQFRLHYFGDYHMKIFLDVDGWHGVDGIVGDVSIVEDGKGGWMLKGGDYEFHLEPIQPEDHLAPQPISRAKSPLNGTTWCFFDGKGKLHIVTFATNGTVSDTRAPSAKPQWTSYDNGTAHYSILDKGQTLTLDAEKKILLRETNKVREIWFSGRQPPRLSMTDAKQLKDRLAEKSMAWFNYDDAKKTTYIFDDKNNNVNIILDDGKTKSVRWEPLSIGIIRIGDEAFLVEGDTLERIEPRMTLKQEPNL